MPEWVSLSQAAALVNDGMTLALGGMTIYRRPVAFVIELLRRSPRPTGLTLACFTAGIESDLLVGAGCVSVMRSCYVGLESFGFAPMFTARAGTGQLQIIEETEASFALGLRAAAQGIGFMPSRAWMGTDLPALRPDVKAVTDPYTGDRMLAFPALSIDACVIHGLEGDASGSIRLNANMGVDQELCATAKLRIATVERRVGQVDPALPGPIIPPPGIDFVALAPRGAQPTSCFPDYPIAGSVFLDYVDACNAGQFDAFVERLSGYAC